MVQCNGDVMCVPILVLLDPTATAPPPLVSPSASGSLSVSGSVVVALSPYLSSLTRSLPLE
jgi:hypothetical protein